MKKIIQVLPGILFLLAMTSWVSAENRQIQEPGMPGSGMRGTGHHQGNNIEQRNELRRKIQENRDGAKQIHQRSMNERRIQDAERLARQEDVKERYARVLEQRRQLKNMSEQDRQAYKQQHRLQPQGKTKSPQQ